MMSRKIVLGLLALIVTVAAVAVVTGPTTPAAEGQEGAKYKGSKACKMCHDDEHAAWSEMKHSKAIESLSAEQIATGKDEKGRVCISCHTTGYGKPGGFVDMEKSKKLVNVGCESCHGPGSKHIMTMAMAEEGEEVAEKFISKSVGCTQCHNPHISYKKLYGKK